MNAKEFFHSLPDRIAVEALVGKHTLFHFDLGDDGQYSVKVDDGTVTVEEGLVGEPKCVVRSTSAHLEKILSGSLNPMMAVMSGKLKISNLSEMMTYARLFGLKI